MVTADSYNENVVILGHIHIFAVPT